MLSLRQARQTIDTKLWNALKEKLFKELELYRTYDHNPYDEYTQRMSGLVNAWFGKDRTLADKMFLTELIKRYRRQGGRFIGEEDKKVPEPLKTIEYKLDGNKLTPMKQVEVKGVPNPPKQLKLFKFLGGNK